MQRHVSNVVLLNLKKCIVKKEYIRVYHIGIFF